MAAVAPPPLLVMTGAVVPVPVTAKSKEASSGSLLEMDMTAEATTLTTGLKETVNVVLSPAAKLKDVGAVVTLKRPALEPVKLIP